LRPQLLDDVADGGQGAVELAGEVGGVGEEPGELALHRVHVGAAEVFVGVGDGVGDLVEGRGQAAGEPLQRTDDGDEVTEIGPAWLVTAGRTVVTSLKTRNAAADVAAARTARGSAISAPR
jgi:hypothetical protein